MPRVVHFEIPADDPARAVKFYETVFGWKIEKWDGPADYWLAMTGEDGQTRHQRRDHHRPRGIQRTVVVNTMDVPSIDDFTAKVVASGGSVLHARRYRSPASATSPIS